LGADRLQSKLGCKTASGSIKQLSLTAAVQ